jgi:undecaprenyl-diphosphatase
VALAHGHLVARRAGLVAVAVAAAVVVGLTRIYLRAHYLSDVLGGAGVAIAVFALCGAVALTVDVVRHNDGR